MPADLAYAAGQHPRHAGAHRHRRLGAQQSPPHPPPRAAVRRLLAKVSDKSEQGIIMLVVCASLFRQYEFVQQQWLNYGLDSNAGNDTCPLVGNHSDGTMDRKPGGRRPSSSSRPIRKRAGRRSSPRACRSSSRPAAASIFSCRA